MDLDRYEALTGTTVATADETKYTAVIRKVRRKLEALLGYTLKGSEVNNNQYTETGKTQSECPLPDTELTLDSPDAVTFAYRIFPYHKHDAFFEIDPASEVHKVKLVKDGVTYKTYEADEFTKHYKNGRIKYIELVEPYNCVYYCQYVQLAVDATWLWQLDANLPEDLLDVWVEMVNYYVDDKNNIKSETLATHSYTRVDAGVPPETKDENLSILKRYAGPNGTLHNTLAL